jgi:hypothetical protein
MYNNLFLIMLLVITHFGVFSNFAYGKELQLQNPFIPSLFDYTTGDGLVQALGVKFKYVNAYRGSDQYGLEATLDGAIQWRSRSNLFFIENFNLNGIELGWRNYVKPKWLMQSGFRHETVLPSSKTKQGGLNEFPHRGSHVFGFFEFRQAIDDEWRHWATGRISGGPSDFGIRAEISYAHQFFLQSYGSAAEVELFLSFGDKEQINSYFGISEPDAIASGLTQIKMEGGFRSSGINIIYRKSVLEDIQIVVGGRLEYYSNEIKNSSLVNDASEASADASLIYRF